MTADAWMWLLMLNGLVAIVGIVSVTVSVACVLVVFTVSWLRKR